MSLNMDPSDKLSSAMKTGSLHTQAQVNRFLATRVSHRQALSDSRIRGLQLEVLPTGSAKWRLRYGTHHGRKRTCITLGNAFALSLADARALAEGHLREILLGNDPQQAKQAAKQVPTFAEFIDQQYLPYVKNYKRSWQTDVSLLRNHLLPRFGKRHLDEIRREDIVKLHHDRHASGAAPGSANRLLIMMRYVFNLALRWEVPGVKSNPSHGIPMMQENNKRERYLSVDEAQRLYDAVCQSKNPMLRYIVPMLILTGARKQEVLTAQWQDFDLDRRLWRIPLAKSGQARHVPLSDGALSILRELSQHSSCPYPFANPQTRKPYVSIFHPWHTARCKVGLSDVRIHDLRHSFASLLINSGRTLYEVQTILGHTQVKTTQRYAHLANDTLLAAANTATAVIGNAMAPKLPVGEGPLSA